MADAPRVAFFTDTFEEINGVALTSRQLVDYARRNSFPMLCVRGGAETSVAKDGSITHMVLQRSRAAVNLDRGLRHDPILWRFKAKVAEELEKFRPDIIHVVSPGDVSEIGTWLAKRDLRVPLAISWHTNLHEFGAARLESFLGWLADRPRRTVGQVAEKAILEIVLAFYRLGDVLYAPNPELVELLASRLHKPVHLMTRGVDTHLFRPDRRTARDGIRRLGYVGRITPEKSVRFFRELEAGLNAAGAPPFRFLIIGDGSDREWLKHNLVAADLPGIERGETLANSYANMDVFVFPSRSDTFGNVVLESFASGVPAVVTNAGGPRFIVRESVSGFVANDDASFIDRTHRLLVDSTLRETMGASARQQAEAESWDTVFSKVYSGYESVQRERVERFAAQA